MDVGALCSSTCVEGAHGTDKGAEVQPIDREVVSNQYVLSTADGVSLVSAVLDIEIREALFDIGNEKAPGPDGFSSAFFKSRWDLVGGDVCRAVWEFFVTGVLLKNWNHTILALLLKVSGSPWVSDFRLIGLTNVLYKVITKILSRRLYIFLPKLVDEAQDAFVQGRNIVDNIFVARELVRGYNKSRCTPSSIDEYIQKWGHHTLSYALKVELIRSVIQGVEGFWFQVFPLHDAVLKKIRSSCTHFFWGGRPARVTWDDICTPKLEGGLGLMDLWKWNVVLLTRAIWHLYRDSDSI
ncbi:hypothetical protein LIER_26442 [Lithospermum erythrorhizon]|uniref:Reverse transcriptase domain-containing protein n=1 Tax=Lithospermum erythrorhizon TaxID=34254 RepID=A0AAV3R8M5_LITER